MSRKRPHHKDLAAGPPTGKRGSSALRQAGRSKNVDANSQSTSPPPSSRQPRSFLGPELAAGVLDNEEAPEFSLKVLLKDPKIRDLGLRLWRQFSGAGATNERAMNESGLTFADLWKPGVTESVTTSSTAEELSRYRQTLEYRAKFLEALLEETLADLERAVQMKPSASGDPAAFSLPASPSARKDREDGISQEKTDS